MCIRDSNTLIPHILTECRKISSVPAEYFSLGRSVTLRMAVEVYEYSCLGVPKSRYWSTFRKEVSMRSSVAFLRMWKSTTCNRFEFSKVSRNCSFRSFEYWCVLYCYLTNQSLAGWSLLQSICDCFYFSFRSLRLPLIKVCSIHWCYVLNDKMQRLLPVFGGLNFNGYNFRDVVRDLIYFNKVSVDYEVHLHIRRLCLSFWQGILVVWIPSF